MFVTSKPFFYDKLKNEYTMWRKTEGISYFSFFTERWANYLGERVTGQKSMENLIID